MNIKFPTAAHIPGLKHLWQVSFGDKPAAIDSFFATGFSQDRCLLAEDDGIVTAALYWFPCDYAAGRLAYLYGVATHPDHRGKGLCRRLLRETHRHLASQGYWGGLLVPAEASLFSFYGGVGYLPCCPKFSRDVPDLTPYTKVTPEVYREEREHLLPPNTPRQPAAVYRYLATYCDFYLAPGKALCITRDPAPRCQECLPHIPLSGSFAMYLPFRQDCPAPQYFALPMD